MPSKAKRKKQTKYTGQQRAQTPPAVQTANTSAPAPSFAARTRAAAPRVQPEAAPAINLANASRELKTIGAIAGVLLVVLVIVAKVLA